MSDFNNTEFKGNIYYIMSEQPNCCPHCQWRLDIIKNIVIDNEAVQLNYCRKCEIKILMVE